MRRGLACVLVLGANACEGLTPTVSTDADAEAPAYLCIDKDGHISESDGLEDSPFDAPV